ncbi:MAG: prenyltransferase [Sandaracinaceae bacterium]|nr:prenyltransferase [Sandaracinaceae bacterium]
MSVGAWLRAARPLAHANIAPPILLGQAFGFASTGTFDPILASVAFGFGVLDHLTIVFANDYADRESDALADERTIFSGGSRVIPDGLIEPRHLKLAAIGAAATLVIGSAVAGFLLGRDLLPAFAAAALALLYAYSYEPFRLSYRGYGEIVQGLGVGLVLPLLGWYAQTGDVTRAPYDAFAPLVMLAFASNILTALPDHAGDARAAKRSWPVRRGEARARRDALVLVGVGVALATQVGPVFSMEWTAAIVGPPALAVLLAFGWMKEGRPVLPFVTFAAGAITVLHVAWSVALLVADSRVRGALGA